jgi:hypothetical protein
MPGTFSAPNKMAQNWKFVLTTTKIDTNTIKADTTYIAPIIYARKNIV